MGIEPKTSLVKQTGKKKRKGLRGIEPLSFWFARKKKEEKKWGLRGIEPLSYWGDRTRDLGEEEKGINSVN